MAIKSDEVPHPDEIEDNFEWGSCAEGHLDPATSSRVSAAYRLIKKFPDWSRHNGGKIEAAGVLSSLLVFASIAVSRKTRRGHSLQSAVNSVKVENLNQAFYIAAREQRWKRYLRKLVRGKK